MTDLTDLTLAAALDGLKSKQFSSAEITGAFLQAMEKARILNEAADLKVLRLSNP